ncbi:serpentine type 7TM GPCR chemoreceptor srv domain-containing protein [Ditylenchus destructor]|uniref:Serpentine type 7TM GPCR chemoreceptor srv domain-containing protein n=1 Tax=Ditylenchus destructor TaxID=166010 RepID=A0AAD4N225_9BILA|nr:serpentine type 7TM GPCR chemoreceptor srv domain-containing protein [Ditylenchus destructor]
MTNNIERSGLPNFEEQKKKLHLILLSKGEGYITVPEILKDLKNECGLDGIALAKAHGYQSFQTFLESTSMREYCRFANEPRTTTVYYGIGNNKTQHIEREMQLSLPAELEKAKKEIRKLRRQLDAVTSQPNERNALPIRGFASAKSEGLLQKQTDYNFHEKGVQTKMMDTAIDSKQTNEKSVQTEDPAPHEILATLKFLYEPHAKGQIIDRRKDPKLLYSCTRTVTLQYYGNITVKEMIARISSKYPNDDLIHEYEVHTVHFYCLEVSGDSRVVPKGNYTIELSLQEDYVPHKIFATLKCLSNRYAKDEIINRHGPPESLYSSSTTVYVAYKGNINVKDILAKIRQNYPSDMKLQKLKKYEVHTARYFEPSFNGKDYVNVSGESIVVPNGKSSLQTLIGQQQFWHVTNFLTCRKTVVFYRMPKIQAIPDPILAHPVGTLAVFIINWLFYLQCIFHATIAVNRYTMIVHSNGCWEKIWRGRNIRILIVFMIIIAMLPAIPRLWCNAKAVNHDQTCDSTNTAVGNVITPVISTLTSIISFSIELRTFVLFQRLGEAARRKRREDFRLLVYAVCQFVGQLLMTLQTIGTVISITLKLTEMRFYTKAAHSIVIAILCLSGPICLFSTSKVLRQKYVQFYNLRGYDSTCTPIGVTVITSLATRHNQS